MKQHRPRRLQNFSYFGNFTYFVTICTDWKKKVFFDRKNYNNILKILKETASKRGFLIHAWCFMPDHIHVIIQGAKDDSSLMEFMKFFKQKSGYFFKKDTGDKLWQDGYYEHVLRKDEALESVVLYILQNPVRSNLADHYSNYPFLGSDTFDINLL